MILKRAHSPAANSNNLQQTVRPIRPYITNKGGQAIQYLQRSCCPVGHNQTSRCIRCIRPTALRRYNFRPEELRWPRSPAPPNNVAAKAPQFPVAPRPQSGHQVREKTNKAIAANRPPLKAAVYSAGNTQCSAQQYQYQCQL